MAERILQGSAAPISVSLYAGSVPVDPTPDSAAITVLRADGTTLVSAALAMEGGVGIFTHTLTPTETAALENVTAYWTFVANGYSQTRSTTHEIVGGYLCALSDLATLYPDETDEELARRRTELERRLERACGYAFAPRYAREATTSRRGKVRLRGLPIRRIVSATSRGGQVTVSNLDVDSHLGVVYGLPSSTRREDTVLSYEYGFDASIDRTRAIMLSAAREVYGPDRVDGRVRRKAVDNVSVTYATATEITGGSALEFTSSDVVSFIQAYQRPRIR